MNEREIKSQGGITARGQVETVATQLRRLSCSHDFSSHAFRDRVRATAAGMGLVSDHLQRDLSRIRDDHDRVATARRVLPTASDVYAVTHSKKGAAVMRMATKYLRAGMSADRVRRLIRSCGMRFMIEQDANNDFWLEELS